LVEHSLGKGEVTSSILVIGSRFEGRIQGVASFEQAVLKVEREREFTELKNAISRAFAADRVEKLLKRLAREKVRVRDWDSVLARGVLDKGDGEAGVRAQSLYDSLAVSDQAQIREFYLFRVEEVSPRLRARFHRLYQYY
jgi:hypothetical protein